MGTHETTVLDEAKSLIYGDRQEQYGGALESFTNIAGGWSIILGRSVTAEQVTLCMDWLKTCRLMNQPGHHDSIVDKAGYSGCYEKIRNERDREDALKRQIDVIFDKPLTDAMLNPQVGLPHDAIDPGHIPYEHVDAVATQEVDVPAVGQDFPEF